MNPWRPVDSYRANYHSNYQMNYLIISSKNKKRNCFRFLKEKNINNGDNSQGRSWLISQLVN